MVLWKGSQMKKILLFITLLTSLNFGQSREFILFDDNVPDRWVSFTFDDDNISDYTFMKPVFDANGVPANVGVYSGSIGLSLHLDASQLNEMQQSGWEICSHTISHQDLTTLDSATIVQEVYGSKLALLGYGLSVNSLFYPYGAYNQSVIDIAKNYYRAAALSGSSTVNSKETFNKYYFRRINIGVPPFTTDRIDTLKKGEWLVYYTHSTDADYAAAFDLLIKHIKSKNIGIITINEGLGFMGVPDSVLATPTGLVATGGWNKIVLNGWEVPVGTDSLYVLRGTSPTGVFNKIAALSYTSTNYTDSAGALVLGSVYYYKILAKNNYAISGFSAVVFDTVDAVLPDGMDYTDFEYRCNSTGIAYIPSTQAYGTWEFDYYKTANTSSRISFIDSDNNDATNLGGYNMYMTVTESIQLIRASAATLFTTASDYFNDSTYYSYKIVRTAGGEFSVYSKTGINEYSLVTASTGSNPVTSTSLTTSAYLVLSFSNTDRIKNIKFNGGAPMNISTFTVVSGVFAVIPP